ncbi:MAG: hypothetical protein E6K81_03790 [Candidatus Eisenbacteria bacterium]|uniref:GYD domain-containing protein n=1 Tax=Eiseniibacteriota bacterium TaxID=2212470 RepID=A0A538UD13_UNCEI|nr:MAG: hypothetical protein E6K81_03790 [Candidatus Eisenbacteria bacterium]
MRRTTLVLVGCLAMMLMAASVFAQGEKAKPAMKSKMAMPAMSTYMIESPHTEEECMAVMDETAKMKDLGAWSWGCMDGNHTAYRMVQAKDEAAALAMVPENVRAKAHAYKVTKMTPAMLASAHKQHM